MAILKKGNILGVCVHHSAVSPGAKNITELKARAKSYNDYHSKKSWAETIKTKGEFGYPYIEYHYMIAKDGSLLQVQDEKYVLYHAGDNFRGNLSFNLHGIAVVLDGNYETEKPTEAMMETLVKLIRDIQKRYKIDARVRGHKETSQPPTACPGKNIGTSGSGWLKSVISNVNDKNYPPKPEQPPQAPVVPSNCEKQEKEILDLKQKIDTLEHELGAKNRELNIRNAETEELKRSLTEIGDKFTTLSIEKNRIENDYNKSVEELNLIKASRFFGVLGFLEKLFPKRK